jgi:hypothetical protein
MIYHTNSHLCHFDRAKRAEKSVVELSLWGIMSEYEKIVGTFTEYVQKLQKLTERICKEKQTWLTREKKIKAKEKSRKRQNLRQRKNEN